MAGDQRALEILIRAKDQASAEMRKVSENAKRTGAEVKKSMGTDVLGSIKDSVNELKAFVRGFSILQAGRLLFGLIQEWREVAAETAKARQELETYLSFRGLEANDSLRAVRDELEKTLELTPKVATQMVVLGDQFGLSAERIRKTAEEAQFLAKEFPNFGGDGVKAFEALGKASEGFFADLQKGTELVIQNSEDFAKLRLHISAVTTEYGELHKIYAELQAIGTQAAATLGASLTSETAARVAKLTADARRLEAAIRLARNTSALEGLSPVAAERAKAEAEAAKEIERQNRAIQVQVPLVEEIAIDRSDFAAGLREGFEEFKQGVTNFREQGRQTVLSLLGGVSQLGLASVDTLVTRTASARDALKQFVTDMLRLLAQLAAQLAASRLLGLLFNAVGGAAAPNGFQQGLQNAGVNGGIGQPLAMGAGIGTGPNGGGAGGGTTNIIFNVVDMAGADEFLVRHRNTIIQIVAGAAGSNRDFRVAMQVR